MVMDRLAASQPANRHSCLGEREEHDTPNLVSGSRLLLIKGPCFLFVHSVQASFAEELTTVWMEPKMGHTAYVRLLYGGTRLRPGWPANLGVC